MNKGGQGQTGHQAPAFHRMQDYYSDVLLKYLADPQPPSLADAQQFGTKAIDEGLELDEIAAIHHEALRVALRQSAVQAPSALDPEARGMKAAGDFFAASMLPYKAHYHECQEAAAALRHMNRRLEDQAGRIAHAIHDEPLQLVAATHMVLNEIAANDDSGQQKHLSAVAVFLNKIESQLATLSLELHPCVLDHLGLEAAANWLAQYFNRTAGTDIVVEASLRLPLAMPLARVLYRAIQEALTNVAAHARASNVFIRLRQEGRAITCSIRDDGQGFDASPGLAAAGERGLGLIAIRESVRACGGNVRLETSISGTELTIVVPMKEEAQNTAASAGGGSA